MRDKSAFSCIFLAAFWLGRLFNSESMMTDSQRLLAEYAANGSDRAFRELVVRYVDLVYSTAIRLVDGDAHRAKDVAQTVFFDLSRTAAKLSPNSMLGGWLHRHTCFVARTVMRGERRRQARERQAMEMNALNDHADMALAEIAPVLDAAINELGADDRDAILLRFFERRNLRSVGEALGINENVAQKRVTRAVQELATLLRRRGFTLPAAALATGLTAGAVTAAPAGLALSIAGTVFADAGAAGGAGLTSAKVAVMAKIKVGVICATLAAGLVTVLFLQHQSKARLRAESALEPTVQPESAASQPPEPAVQEPASRPAQAQQPQARSAAPPPASPNVEVATPPARQSVALPEPAVVEYPSLPLQRFAARPGSKVRIEGTANIINPIWYVESPIIGGSLELGPGFPLAAGQALEPGPVPAQAKAFISVLSLKSVDNDGRPYSSKMDEIMYETLRSEHYKQIRFDLVELLLRGATNIDRVLQYELEARGVLTIAGVTNEVTMPVLVLPEANGRLKISGGMRLKMTWFGIEPPDINLVVGHIKVGDQVSIKFDWVVAPSSTSSNLTQHGLVPLVLELPAPAFKGIPQDLQVGPNVEPLSDKPRATMMVPPDLQNLAPGSSVTCSDKNIPADSLAKLTDGDKEASDQSIVFLRKGRQWVQMDFGVPQELFALVIWHAHNMAKVYHDVIVRVADDPDFTEKVRTVFNNDSDNSSGLGVGRDREYFETYEGKRINAKGVKARYIRFYSNGSTESALNEYTEIEIYGRQAQ
jgi:RNA polymerase sigma factor (sigma-70 family)